MSLAGDISVAFNLKACDGFNTHLSPLGPPFTKMKKIDFEI